MTHQIEIMDLEWKASRKKNRSSQLHFLPQIVLNLLERMSYLSPNHPKHIINIIQRAIATRCTGAIGSLHRNQAFIDFKALPIGLQESVLHEFRTHSRMVAALGMVISNIPK